MAGGLIDSTEMYLRTVLELEEEGITALRARLAERLDLSAPSVSEGVARLEADGLVRLEADRRVSLTDPGREIATQVMRKHRLAERLLVDVLGVEPEHVHEEACRWEHVISDRVEAKLVEFLGNPTTSPYGNPIPGSATGEYERLTLADARGARVRIERISEQLQSNHDVMHALEELGVHAGDEVTVDREGAGDGITLSVHGTSAEVDATSARLLYVSEV